MRGNDAGPLAEVSPKVLQGIHQQLAYHHHQQVQADNEAHKALHQSLIEHYTLLLERWEI